MGFADLVQAEETVSIKISEYRELIENNTELDMLRQVSNGTAPEVYVRILRKGAETAFNEADREELKAYRETGITPDRFQVIDEEYRKLSKENAGLIEGAARLKEENKQLSEDKARLFDQVVLLEKTIKGLKKDLVERDAQIDELESSVKSKQEYIEALEARIRRG